MEEEDSEDEEKEVSYRGMLWRKHYIYTTEDSVAVTFANTSAERTSSNAER